MRVQKMETPLFGLNIAEASVMIQIDNHIT
jgi:hypothetical protein